MRLSQPTKAVFNWSWIIAVLGAVVFVLSFFITSVAFLGWAAFGLMTVAFVLLMLGVALKGF